MPRHGAPAQRRCRASRHARRSSARSETAAARHGRQKEPMGDKAPAPEPIQWLGDATGGSDLLGGKAASIDRLARLGVPTPPGFCITTDAFRQELLDGPMRDAAARALAD